MQDIQASIDYLRSQGIQEVGALAIASSVLIDGLDAAAPFYGIPRPELADPGKAKTPLQCHFGTADEIINYN